MLSLNKFMIYLNRFSFKPDFMLILLLSIFINSNSIADDKNSSEEITNSTAYAVEGHPWPPEKLVTDSKQMNSKLKEPLIIRSKSLALPLENLELTFSLFIHKGQLEKRISTQYFGKNIELIVSHLFSEFDIKIETIDLVAPFTTKSHDLDKKMAKMNNNKAVRLTDLRPSNYLKLIITANGRELLAKNGLSVLIMQLHHYFETSAILFQLHSNSTLSEQLNFSENTLKQGHPLKDLVTQVLYSQPSIDPIEYMYEKNDSLKPIETLLDLHYNYQDNSVELDEVLEEYFFEKTKYKRDDFNLLEYVNQLDVFDPAEPKQCAVIFRPDFKNKKLTR